MKRQAQVQLIRQQLLSQRPQLLLLALKQALAITLRLLVEKPLLQQPKRLLLHLKIAPVTQKRPLQLRGKKSMSVSLRQRTFIPTWSTMTITKTNPHKTSVWQKLLSWSKMQKKKTAMSSSLITEILSKELLLGPTRPSSILSKTVSNTRCIQLFKNWALMQERLETTNLTTD